MDVGLFFAARGYLYGVLNYLLARPLRSGLVAGSPGNSLPFLFN